jgi:hypothetical protein
MAASSMSGGSGHVRPAAFNRVAYIHAVPAAMPSERAISATVSPRSRNRNTSLICAPTFSHPALLPPYGKGATLSADEAANSKPPAVQTPIAIRVQTQIHVQIGLESPFNFDRNGRSW